MRKKCGRGGEVDEIKIKEIEDEKRQEEEEME